jgi:hypothetical protein
LAQQGRCTSRAGNVRWTRYLAQQAFHYFAGRKRKNTLANKAEASVRIFHEDSTDIFVCVGRIVVPFASVEAGVDMVIAAIFHKGIEKKLPRDPFGDRIDYIEEGLKTLPILAASGMKGWRF